MRSINTPGDMEVYLDQLNISPKSSRRSGQYGRYQKPASNKPTWWSENGNTLAKLIGILVGGVALMMTGAQFLQ
jgi:hypothetical protein